MPKRIKSTLPGLAHMRSYVKCLGGNWQYNIFPNEPKYSEWYFPLTRMIYFWKCSTKNFLPIWPMSCSGHVTRYHNGCSQQGIRMQAQVMWRRLVDAGNSAFGHLSKGSHHSPKVHFFFNILTEPQRFCPHENKQLLIREGSPPNKKNKKREKKR